MFSPKKINNQQPKWPFWNLIEDIWVTALSPLDLCQNHAAALPWHCRGTAVALPQANRVLLSATVCGACKLSMPPICHGLLDLSGKVTSQLGVLRSGPCNPNFRDGGLVSGHCAALPWHCRGTAVLPRKRQLRSLHIVLCNT